MRWTGNVDNGNTDADGVGTLPQITGVSARVLGAVFRDKVVLVPWKLEYPKRRSIRLTRSPTVLAPVLALPACKVLAFCLRSPALVDVNCDPPNAS